MDSLNTIIACLAKETFLIKIADDKYIVSLPLRGKAFYADTLGAESLRNVLNGTCVEVDKQLEDYLRELYAMPAVTPCSQNRDGVFSSAISLILTQRCNFECTYCFAHDARGKETMTRDDIRFIVDSWVAQPGPHRKVTFIGGGEPTAAWSLLEWAIEYVRGKVGDVEIVLVTNGSLISHNRLVFLKQAKVRISLSFDILPEIQEAQRLIYNSSQSSFRVVDSFLKDIALVNANAENGEPVRVGIRSTITPNTVGKMTDMVHFVHENYEGVVKIVHFEHVTSSNNTTIFYQQYEKEFFKARDFGQKVGIKVINSLIASQGKVRNSFCMRESCFVPAGEDGIICTACHRVSSIRDRQIEKFKYAESYKRQEFRFFGSSVDDLRGLSEDCEYCPAKWQCAGGCIMERLILPPELFRKKCEMVRGFNRRLLEEKLNKQ